jgi:hypothetical protein
MLYWVTTMVSKMPASPPKPTTTDIQVAPRALKASAKGELSLMVEEGTMPWGGVSWGRLALVGSWGRLRVGQTHLQNPPLTTPHPAPKCNPSPVITSAIRR